MIDLGTHCGEHLACAATLCARCGVRVTRNDEPLHEHPPAEKVPVTGAFSGLHFGLIAMPLLLIVGGMSCLTDLGAILGVPILIMAVLAPLAGPLFGMGVGKDEHGDQAAGATPPLR